MEKTKRIVLTTAAGTVITFTFINGGGIVLAESSSDTTSSNISTQIAKNDRLVNAYWKNKIENIKEKIQTGGIDAESGQKIVNLIEYKMAMLQGRPGEFAEKRLQRRILAK